MRFPVSDHCDGQRFFNPGPWSGRTMRDLLKWKLSAKPAQWPGWVEIRPGEVPAVKAGEIAVTWINHATFLIQTAAGNLLTDPVFSERTSPFSWIGPKRVHRPGVAFEELPRIDAVLISHDHYDHLDLPSLRRIAAVHRATVIAPLGYSALMAEAGLRCVELDWWQEHLLAADLKVTLAPARHWCRRRPGGTNVRLWGGYAIAHAGKTVFFAGDSGYDGAMFREIAARAGQPDLALLPIGAYEPRWFMQSAHMNPADAVEAHRDLGAKRSLGMHWGTWQLTDEGREDPPRALVAARTAAGVSEAAFFTVTPGETAHLK